MDRCTPCRADGRKKTNNPEDKDRGILTRDSVHLTPAGNKLVAEQMLTALGEKLK